MLIIVIVGGKYHGHRFENTTSEWGKRVGCPFNHTLRNINGDEYNLLVYRDESLSPEAAELALLGLNLPELEGER